MKSLYSWNWQSRDGEFGGYNQCMAESKAEALETGNAISKNLWIEEKTLVKVVDREAFWRNYPCED